MPVTTTELATRASELATLSAEVTRLAEEAQRAHAAYIAASEKLRDAEREFEFDAREARALDAIFRAF